MWLLFVISKGKTYDLQNVCRAFIFVRGIRFTSYAVRFWILFFVCGIRFHIVCRTFIFVRGIRFKSHAVRFGILFFVCGIRFHIAKRTFNLKLNQIKHPIFWYTTTLYLVLVIYFLRVCHTLFRMHAIPLFRMSVKIVRHSLFKHTLFSMLISTLNGMSAYFI